MTCTLICVVDWEENSQMVVGKQPWGGEEGSQEGWILSKSSFIMKVTHATTRSNCSGVIGMEL
jgi:hypothetical protein